MHEVRLDNGAIISGDEALVNFVMTTSLTDGMCMLLF